MLKFHVLLVFSFISTIAFAQEHDRAEVFGGYSYLNADSNGFGPRVNVNGWEASLSVNATRLLAGEIDFSGYYRTVSLLPAVPTIVDEHVYVYLVGPRLNIGRAFIHALVGIDNATASAFGVSASQNSVAGAAGGGAEWKVTPHFGVRASADYLLTRQGDPRITQNNFRAAVGLVYGFGGSSQQSAAPAQAKVPRNATPIPTLGLTVVARDSSGAEIVEVLSNSVAGLANLRVGDVINSIDGKRVHSPTELAAELSNRTPGVKVKVGYMVRGYWQSETIVILR
jgi:hypothetical protein